MPKSDSCLAEVIRRHLDIDLVTNADADEVLAHFAGDVREHLVTVGERDAEHGPRKHLGDGAYQLDWFFFWHVPESIVARIHMPFSAAESNPFAVDIVAGAVNIPATYEQ